MQIYHFSDSYIEVFKYTKAKRDYSQASGNGVYFATDYEKGVLKYGNRARYCYICEFTGNQDNILNLGEYDSMYFDGRMIHSCSLVAENFKRSISGIPEIPEPDILIEKLSGKALKFLRSKGIQAIKGMDYWGYACSEFCVIDVNTIRIINRIQGK